MVEQTILGQNVCNVSVLSVAIAPDVSFADRRNLQEVSSQIEVYLDVIANAVSESGGTILTANVCAKGYEILALFGAPISVDDHPRQTVQGALNSIWRFQGDKDCAFCPMWLSPIHCLWPACASCDSSAGSFYSRMLAHYAPGFGGLQRSCRNDPSASSEDDMAPEKLNLCL